MDLISFFAFIFVILGVWRIGLFDIKGQYAMLIAQILWITYSIFAGQSFLLAQSVILLGINVWAIFQWSKLKTGE